MNAEKADQKIYALLKAGELIINRNGGSLTGGSPEGRIKAVIVNPEYDADVKALYQSIKTVFDPKNILNPDAKLGADLKNVVKHLRTTKK